MRQNNDIARAQRLQNALTAEINEAGELLTITRKGLAGQADTVFTLQCLPYSLTLSAFGVFMGQGNQATGEAKAQEFYFPAGSDIRPKDLIAYDGGVWSVGNQITHLRETGLTVVIQVNATLQSQ